MSDAKKYFERAKRAVERQPTRWRHPSGRVGVGESFNFPAGEGWVEATQAQLAPLREKLRARDVQRHEERLQRAKRANIDHVQALLAQGMSPEEAVRAAYPEWSDEQVAELVAKLGSGKEAAAVPWGALRTGARELAAKPIARRVAGGAAIGGVSGAVAGGKDHRVGGALTGATVGAGAGAGYHYAKPHMLKLRPGGAKRVSAKKSPKNVRGAIPIDDPFSASLDPSKPRPKPRTPLPGEARPGPDPSLINPSAGKTGTASYDLSIVNQVYEAGVKVAMAEIFGKVATPLDRAALALPAVTLAAQLGIPAYSGYKGYQVGAPTGHGLGGAALGAGGAILGQTGGALGGGRLGVLGQHGSPDMFRHALQDWHATDPVDAMGRALAGPNIGALLGTGLGGGLGGLAGVRAAERAYGKDASHVRNSGRVALASDHSGVTEAYEQGVKVAMAEIFGKENSIREQALARAIPTLGGAAIGGVVGRQVARGTTPLGMGYERRQQTRGRRGMLGGAAIGGLAGFADSHQHGLSTDALDHIMQHYPEAINVMSREAPHPQADVFAQGLKDRLSGIASDFPGAGVSHIQDRLDPFAQAARGAAERVGDVVKDNPFWNR